MFLKKLKVEIYDPVIPLLCISQNKNSNLKRYMHPMFICGIIYNSQEMEAIQVSINRWVEYYSDIKKNEILPFANNMDGAGGYYGKWNKRKSSAIVLIYGKWKKKDQTKTETDP